MTLNSTLESYAYAKKISSVDWFIWLNLFIDCIVNKILAVNCQFFFFFCYICLPLKGTLLLPSAKCRLLCYSVPPTSSEALEEGAQMYETNKTTAISRIC